MLKNSDRKFALLGSAALALSWSGATLAQDAAPQSDAGEFLGTIDIGESARAIATETATPVTVINRKEIEERQANTIAELLDSIPGVTLINGGTPIGSGINIRGFGANGTYGTDQKVLVMVDGATTGSQELYRIGTQLFTDPLLYKSATVNRGTVGSFEFGSGVIGGVVRLETSDASDLLRGKTGITIAQSLNGQTNSAGFATSTTVAAMPTEQFELLANYTWRELGTQKDGRGVAIGNSAFGLPSFLVKGAVHFGADNAHTVKASYSQTKTTERDKPYDSFGTTGGAFGNIDRDTKSQTLAIGYYYKPIANDAIDLSLVYTSAIQDIEQQAVPAANDALRNADHRYQTQKITLKNTAVFATGSVRHNVRAGLEYINISRLTANSAPGGRDRRMAAFLVDDITLFRGFTVSPAVRWETSSIKGTNGRSYNNEEWMGGVSARYELPLGLAVFGSWATTKSLPILDDLDNVAYMTRPERGKTWELGGSFTRVSLLSENDRLAAKVNYYHTDLLDNTSYSGVREVYLQGWEIEASYATRSGFYLDFNANIVSGERLRNASPTTRPPFIDDWNNLPNDTYQLSVGKRFGSLVDVRWEATLASDLVTRTGNAAGTVFTNVRKEGFDVHSLRASFTPKLDLLKTLAIRVSVENIFDTYYTPGLATRPAPGRTFKGGVTVQF